MLTPDPLAHIGLGDLPPETNPHALPCWAANHSRGVFCTRDRHPADWQHIADDGNRVTAVWTGQ